MLKKIVFLVLFGFGLSANSFRISQLPGRVNTRGGNLDGRREIKTVGR